MLQLFLGDTNRTIAETPLNQASSRSHCIFTLLLEARTPGSDIVRRSKLHIVDLAGSERVAKTGTAADVQPDAEQQPVRSLLSCIFLILTQTVTQAA